ncbi:hypothetical protein [uncultured Microbacterium sp.]|uniref:hypothetical protein n=1 Tax=uncultured Microbacterium sp. TaxID=191216 RepID=UPI0028E23028|nr:hypothetical protein [uncultured Microbacterium sp.]
MKTSPAANLTGSVDQRLWQLSVTPKTEQTRDWLRQQLDSALEEWAKDRTALDIDREGRVDF